MLQMWFNERGHRPPTVLCLGAHCDDIEIGCGGAILKMLIERPGTEVRWVVLSSDETRKAEAIVSADRFLDAAGAKTVSVMGFRDGFFPYHGQEIKEYFESLKEQVDPDLIFTHHGADAHQDHRLVHELTWNTFRNHLILEYEIPKYEGDLSQPNLFVPLDEPTCRMKIGYLHDAFPSQNAKPWYCDETFRAVLKLRGIECRAPSGYAEAFHCRKIVLGMNAKDEQR